MAGATLKAISEANKKGAKRKQSDMGKENAQGEATYVLKECEEER